MPVPAPDLYSRPISDVDPCGEAIDYDLDFLELEMAARGTPAQELGTATVAAEPPDWAEVDRLGNELTSRAKDLRVAVLLARAALNREGLEALPPAMEGIAVYVEAFWDGLHPRPDEEDGDDQTVRLNALGALGDRDGLVADLRAAALSESRVFPRVSLRDWTAAQRPPGGSQAGEDVESIESSFRETPVEVLEARSAALAGVASALGRIESAVKARLGPGHGVPLQVAADTVAQMLRIVDEHRPPPAPAVEEVGEAAADAGPDGPAAPPASAPAAVPGDIRNRNDVVRCIDRICSWYQANEPASPVPPLLERAKRLVSKDFMTLLLELAPDGASQFRALAGLAAEAPKP